MSTQQKKSGVRSQKSERQAQTKAADVDLGALVEEEKARLGASTAKKGKAKAA